jgi:hypothetical protein
LSDSYIESFEVFDNPQDDTIAFVADDNNNGKRNIAINLSVHQQSDVKEQKATLIHELSHIITLNHTQMVSSSSKCPNYETDE